MTLKNARLGAIQKGSTPDAIAAKTACGSSEEAGGVASFTSTLAALHS